MKHVGLAVQLQGLRVDDTLFVADPIVEDKKGRLVGVPADRAR